MREVMRECVRENVRVKESDRERERERERDWNVEQKCKVVEKKGAACYLFTSNFYRNVHHRKLSHHRKNQITSDFIKNKYEVLIST